MSGRKLSAQQQAALDLVAAGRVQYGAEFPDRDRRAAARGRGGLLSPEWLIDGSAAYGQAKRTFSALEERGVIIVRHDLVPQQHVPEQTKAYRDIAGHLETRTIPAHDEPADPGWRADVELATAADRGGSENA